MQILNTHTKSSLDEDCIRHLNSLLKKQVDGNLEESESSETEPAKFTFKRPVKKRDASEMEESAPKSSGGIIGGFAKRVLPECVVGVDPKQGKKKFEPKKIRVADETDDTESSTKSDVSEEEPPAKKKSKASSSKLSFQFEDE